MMAAVLVAATVDVGPGVPAVAVGLTVPVTVGAVVDVAITVPVVVAATVPVTVEATVLVAVGSAVGCPGSIVTSAVSSTVGD